MATPWPMLRSTADKLYSVYTAYFYLLWSPPVGTIQVFLRVPDMRVYDRQIAVINEGEIFPAQLKVIRLPESWYAVIWETPDRYASFSQDKSPRNGDFGQMSDRDFLDRVQLVAGFTQGIEFEYEEAI